MSNENLKNLFPEENQIPKEFKVKFPLHQTEYLINGELRVWSGPMQDVYSPICLKVSDKVTQEQMGSYPLLTEKEALQALQSAEDAYDLGRGEWPTRSIQERIDSVSNFAEALQKKREEIIKLLMWEIGKSFKDSAKEFDRTIIYIQDTIDALKDLDRISSRFQIESGVIAQIRRAPLGVVLCMGPFNYPLNETFTTLIPALIMGNTVVFKPPKIGVLLFQPILEIFKDAFPKGVVNTIYGDGRTVVGPIMESGRINVLAFIGSSRVANILKKQHPLPNRLRSVLGLEAKNPAIILPDADIDLAVKEGVLGALSFNGQRCTALKIFFVHSKIVDQFIEKFIKQITALKLGMPWESGVNITPLPEENKSDFLTSLIEDAKKHGAKIMNPNGGEFDSTLFTPAVLFPVNEKMQLYSEEQFGPLIPIVPYDNIEEPIKYIVESKYGQQVSIFGKDTAEIASLIDHLVNQVCRVNINSQCQRGPDIFPFTGKKDSAEGTLSVSDALRVFTIRTLVAAKETEINKDIITNIVKNHKSNFLSTDFIL